jgi:hypothetical protein
VTARTRCDEAEEARRAVEAAVERTREARRRLAAVRRSADEAAEAADPGRRTEAKLHAREAYLRARALARDEAERTAAVAAWAREVDHVNRMAARARRSLHAARAEAGRTEALVGEAERDEQAARLAADAAQAACLEARVRLAECEELAEETLNTHQAVGSATAGVIDSTSAPGPGTTVRPPLGPPTGSPATARGPVAPRPAAPGPAAQADAPARPHRSIDEPRPNASAGPPPGPRGMLAIEALLDGDRVALERVAAGLSEHTGRTVAEEQLRLRELIEALRSAAARHGHLHFDTRHPLWAHLSEDEARDIVAALARMGFELDPAQGWRGGRAPTPRDLSLALAYAGVEVRTLRQHPDADQIRLLPASIAVDARALLAAEAPDLSLDPVVRMLEGHGDGLGSLWDDWGQVRRILLAPTASLVGGDPGAGRPISPRP